MRMKNAVLSLLDQNIGEINHCFTGLNCLPVREYLTTSSPLSSTTARVQDLQVGLQEGLHVGLQGG